MKKAPEQAETLMASGVGGGAFGYSQPGGRGGTRCGTPRAYGARPGAGWGTGPSSPRLKRTTALDGPAWTDWQTPTPLSGQGGALTWHAVPLQGAGLRQVARAPQALAALPAIVTAQVRIAGRRTDLISMFEFPAWADGEAHRPGSDRVSDPRGQIGIQSCGDGSRPLRHLQRWGGRGGVWRKSGFSQSHTQANLESVLTLTLRHTIP